MSVITLSWTIIATVAMTLALFCALAWSLERRNLGYLMYCLTAVATAACAPFELGMMHAQSPAEYGEWLQNYHLPIFFVLLGQVLFIHFYLGTGRTWALYLFIAWRLAILLTNFLVEPNFHFHEIRELQVVTYFGEPISAIAAATPRQWQWVANASMALLVLFIADAALRRWRKGGRESRRKALVVGLGIGIPMLCNVTLNQLAVFGVIHRPIFAIIWFLGMLAAVAYELGRELILSSRARLQLAELHGEALGRDNNEVPPALAELVFETQEALEDFRNGGTSRETVAATHATLDARHDALLGELVERYRAWDAADPAAKTVLNELKRRLSEIAYLGTLVEDVDEALGV